METQWSYLFSCVTNHGRNFCVTNKVGAAFKIVMSNQRHLLSRLPVKSERTIVQVWQQKTWPLLVLPMSYYMRFGYCSVLWLQAPSGFIEATVSCLALRIHELLNSSRSKASGWAPSWLNRFEHEWPRAPSNNKPAGHKHR